MIESPEYGEICADYNEKSIRFFKNSYRPPDELRFNKSDAVAAGVLTRPYMSATGASMPPKKIAAPNHRHSTRLGIAMVKPREAFSHRAASISIKPMPEPVYNSPANMSGGTLPTRSLASGVLTPKRTADASA